MSDHKEMDTLVEQLEYLREHGFETEFKYMHHGICSMDNLERCYNPNEIKIIEHFRFEGPSDPADMTVLYAIDTTDGIRGFVIDAYGTYANPKLGEFMRKVEATEDTDTVDTH